MIEDVPRWLFHPVPLWVFILALLTSPAKWSRAAGRVMKRRFGGGRDD